MSQPGDIASNDKTAAALVAVVRVTGLTLLVAAPLVAVALPCCGTVAVLAPPGSEPAASVRIVATAGGVLLGPARAGLIVARSDAAGFAQRLYAAGAWLVIGPLPASACGGTEPGASSRQDPALR